MKRGNNKDSLIFKANRETFDIIFKNKNTRTFSITQIDMNDSSRSFPNMDFAVEFECEYDLIVNSLKDADLYSDKLTFTCNDNNLILSCEGSFGKYKNECQLNSVVDDCYSASYGINWLFKIFNNKLSSDNLKISIGNDYPMLVKMENGLIKLNYLIAPRIDSGE